MPKRIRKLALSFPPSRAYRRLLAAFGPQGWWPVTPAGRKQPRYHPAKTPRLTGEQAFEIAAGAILTQNTAWSNVEKALGALHGKDKMSPQKIFAAKDSDLAAWIRSSGYFTQKAKKLKILSRFVLERAGGDILNLKKEPGEALRRQLLGLWGVGPETADSILLYALDKPVFVVDAYTRRIGERLGWPLAKKAYDDVRRFFESHLPRNVLIYQELHALFVELAKQNCAKRNPLCKTCPLARGCSFGIRRLHARRRARH